MRRERTSPTCQEVFYFWSESLFLESLSEEARRRQEGIEGRKKKRELYPSLHPILS